MKVSRVLLLCAAAALIAAGAQPAVADPGRAEQSTVRSAWVHPAQAADEPGVAATTADIVFASFNICKVSCGRGKFSWEKRRPKVLRTISTAAPEVLGVQEATIEYTRDGAPQYLDLSWRLEDLGYVLANPEAEDTELECTRGTHIFYKAGAVESATITTPLGEFSHGLESLQARTSNSAWGPIRDRCFAWAYLRHVPTGGVFLGVSAHLAVEKNRTGEKVRRSSARALASWAEQQNTALGLVGLPVVVMADLNSHKKRQPRGAQYQLMKSGFRDAYTAPDRVNHRYTTSNHVGRSNGWPAGPIKARRNPERIDYVMARNAIAPIRYEVFVRVRGKGRFVAAYRASDHNMVLATWRLPVAAW